MNARLYLFSFVSLFSFTIGLSAATLAPNTSPILQELSDEKELVNARREIGSASAIASEASLVTGVRSFSQSRLTKALNEDITLKDELVETLDTIQAVKNIRQRLDEAHNARTITRKQYIDQVAVLREQDDLMRNELNALVVIPKTIWEKVRPIIAAGAPIAVVLGMVHFYASRNNGNYWGAFAEGLFLITWFLSLFGK